MSSELYVGKGTSGATYIFDENTNSEKVATVHNSQYAQLFAAAPGLLEACEAVYTAWNSGFEDAQGMEMAIYKIQSAINKAKQQ